MKFLLIGLCITFANAITHHSGYTYPPNINNNNNNNNNNNANNGFIPSNGPCCQELAILKQQLAQQHQQILQLQQQQQGRIVHKQEISSGSLNSVHDASIASGNHKGYTSQNQGPVIGNSEFSGAKVFNYHSQGPLAGNTGQIQHIHQHHHGNAGQLSAAAGSSHGGSINHGSTNHGSASHGLSATHGSTSHGSSGSHGSAVLGAAIHSVTSNKGYNYQNLGSLGSGGQVVQGHLLVGNHAGPVNGPSAAQLIANKYSAHANNAYNQGATTTTTILRPPAPQGGFTVTQTGAGYNTNSNGNYNGAASQQNYNGAASQQYAQATKLSGQGSGSYAAGSGSYASGSGLSSISGSSNGFNGNYAGSASDKTYTQTQIANSNEFSLAGQSGVAGQVEKHIYVHVPPEDFADSSEERAKLQQLPTPKKHYKIIFIKAPTISSGPNYQQLLAQQGGLSEEKTLVYVLVKKPDEPSAEEIAAIQSQSSVKHNKPEVFFIKYKTRKEAEQAAQALGHGNSQFLGNFVGSDLGVDIRNAGSINGHEGLESVASAIETAEAYSHSSGSSSSISSSSGGSSGNIASSYVPPPSGPSPAPIYGVPSVKK